MPYPFSPIEHKAHVLLGDPQAIAFDFVCKAADTINTILRQDGNEHIQYSGYDLCLVAESHKHDAYSGQYICLYKENTRPLEVNQELWDNIEMAVDDSLGKRVNFIITDPTRASGRSTRDAVDAVHWLLERPGIWQTVGDHFPKTPPDLGGTPFMVKNMLNCLGIDWQQRTIKDRNTGDQLFQMRIKPRPIDRIYVCPNPTSIPVLQGTFDKS